MKNTFVVINRITSVVNVETYIIDNLIPSPRGWAGILVLLYIETISEIWAHANSLTRLLF